MAEIYRIKFNNGTVAYTEDYDEYINWCKNLCLDERIDIFYSEDFINQAIRELEDELYELREDYESLRCDARNARDRAGEF